MLRCELLEGLVLGSLTQASRDGWTTPHSPGWDTHGTPRTCLHCGGAGSAQLPARAWCWSRGWQQEILHWAYAVFPTVGTAEPGRAEHQGCHTGGQRMPQQPSPRGSVVPALLLLCDGRQGWARVPGAGRTANSQGAGVFWKLQAAEGVWPVQDDGGRRGGHCLPPGAWPEEKRRQLLN